MASNIFYEKGKKYNCRVKNIPYFRKSVTINGKPRQVYGDGEKDANRKIEELKKLAADGFDLDKNKAKVKDAFQHWLYDIKRVDSQIKDSTFARYDETFRTNILPYNIMEGKLSKLTSAHMQAYINELAEEHGVTVVGFRSITKVWRMFIDWAIDEGYLIKNPMRKLVLPGEYHMETKAIEIFTEEERNKLLKYMDEHYYQYDTLIKLAFLTGMRRGELLGLKWEDIKDDNTIHVQRSVSYVAHVDKNAEHYYTTEVWDPKTKNANRTIPILPSTAKMLKEHKHKQLTFFLAHGLGAPEFVFTTSKGKIIDGASLRKSYERLLTRAGVPYRKFHAIRHTFATEAIRRGVDVHDLQHLMGHSEVQTTFIYVQSDDKSRAHAIEKMGAII